MPWTYPDLRTASGLACLLLVGVGDHPVRVRGQLVGLLSPVDVFVLRCNVSLVGIDLDGVVVRMGCVHRTVHGGVVPTAVPVNPAWVNRLAR